MQIQRQAREDKLYLSIARLCPVPLAPRHRRRRANAPKDSLGMVIVLVQESAPRVLDRASSEPVAWCPAEAVGMQYVFGHIR